MNHNIINMVRELGKSPFNDIAHPGTNYTAMVMISTVDSIMRHMLWPAGMWSFERSSTGHTKRNDQGYFSDKFDMGPLVDDGQWAMACKVRVRMMVSGEEDYFFLQSLIRPERHRPFQFQILNVAKGIIATLDMDISVEASVQGFLRAAGAALGEHLTGTQAHFRPVLDVFLTSSTAGLRQ
jgi:hypothetical protein